MIPSRDLAVRAHKQRCCLRARIRKRATFLKNRDRVVKGPLLPSGAFLSDPEVELPDNYIFPEKTTWGPYFVGKPVGRGGNGESVFLSLRALTSRDARTLGKNPSTQWKNRLPVGEYEVSPTREDVQIFRRKVWIYYDLSRVYYHAQSIMAPTERTVSALSKAIFLGAKFLSSFGNETKLQRGLVSKLAYCRRRLRKLTSGKLKESFNKALLL